jgi:hypothetical protein
MEMAGRKLTCSQKGSIFSEFIAESGGQNPRQNTVRPKVSPLGVDSLWGDCTFIPADWGS